MRKLLLATTALLGLGLLNCNPANALLTVAFQASGTGGNATGGCTDGAGCDAQGLPDVLQTNFQALGQFNVFGTLSISSTGSLTASNFGIQNTGGAGTLTMFVTDDGFATPVTSIDLSASGTFINMVGSPTSTVQFFANNGLLFTATGTPATPVDSFDGTVAVPFALATGTFSMAELGTFNFAGPGGSLIGFNAGMVTQVEAVPEPSTWAMMLLGFLGIAAVGARKSWQGFRLA